MRILSFSTHTYLTFVAKTMAAKVLGVDISDSDDLLSGRRFQEAGIYGAVESDFFDWILASSKGPEPGESNRSTGQSRFSWKCAKPMSMKGLYESLIDTEQTNISWENTKPRTG
jgi:hypothetical protein